MTMDCFTIEIGGKSFSARSYARSKCGKVFQFHVINGLWDYLRLGNYIISGEHSFTDGYFHVLSISKTDSFETVPYGVMPTKKLKVPTDLLMVSSDIDAELILGLSGEFPGIRYHLLGGGVISTEGASEKFVSDIDYGIGAYRGNEGEMLNVFVEGDGFTFNTIKRGKSATVKLSREEAFRMVSQLKAVMDAEHNIQEYEEDFEQEIPF